MGWLLFGCQHYASLPLRRALYTYILIHTFFPGGAKPKHVRLSRETQRDYGAWVKDPPQKANAAWPNALLDPRLVSPLTSPVLDTPWCAISFWWVRRGRLARQILDSKVQVPPFDLPKTGQMS